MAEDRMLEAFQALHRDLTNASDAVKLDRDGRGSDALLEIATSDYLQLLGDRFQQLLAKSPRRKESRDAVLSGQRH